MGIFSILSRNSAQGSRTRGPEAHVPYPDGFRGLITHDARRCTICRTCAYVCSPSAITFAETEGRFVDWSYFAGQCTFCGRCVEYCPTRCLGFEASMPPIATDQSAHRVIHRVSYQPCARCGRPVIPLPIETLRAIHGDPVPGALSARQTYCERCRGRAAADGLKGLGGSTGDD